MSNQEAHAAGPRFGRRAFLQGVAATGLGVMGAALLPGCGAQPQTETQSETENAGATAEADVQSNDIHTELSKLNPQRTDYASNTTDLATMFSPLQMGSMTIKNRFVKSSGSTGFWQVIDSPESPKEYYLNMVNNGLDLILTECFASYFTEYPATGKDYLRDIPWAAEVVQAVHDAGGHMVFQMDTMSTGTNGDTANKLTTEELITMQQDSINMAVECQAIGFDGVEINVGARNAGAVLLSRYDNTRTDQFSAESLEKRTRYAVDIIKGIKEKCGEDFFVQILMNGVEENDTDLGQNTLFTTIEEGIEIAKIFESAGADALHLRIGVLNHVAQFMGDLFWTGRGIDGTTGNGTQFDFSRHFQGILQSDTSGCGFMLPLVAEYKKALSIPVGAASYMDPAIAPDMFENALAAGEIDFLVMNRPLNVDPAYIAKLQEGRIDEIRPCTRCCHCFFDYMGDDGGMAGMRCRQNACTRRAYNPNLMPEGFTPTPAENPRNIMVIGGGPAGVEAATVCAQRGHSVTLYESKGSIGGLLEFANNIKGQHEHLDLMRAWMERQLEVDGVTVATNQEVNAEFVESEAPDAVIVAVGGVREQSGISGTESTPVVPLTEVMTAEIGQNVTIIGGNAQAVDTAWYLLEQGKNITIVMADPLDQLAKGQSKQIQSYTLPMLYARGGRVWDSSEIVSVGEGEVTLVNAAGIEITVPCDTVVDAIDLVANTEFIESIEATGIETYAVGDCESPWNILEAIHSANNVARRI